MSVPADLKYTSSHEWIRREGDIITVGITHHAQDQLGEVVYVDLPDEGDDTTAGEGCAEIESTKAVSDIYAPADGEIVAINEDLDDDPEIVNKDCYGAGWLFKIKVTGDMSDLLDAAAYQASLGE